MESDDWYELIKAELNGVRSIVKAHTFRGRCWESLTRPVLLGCDDGYDYVVKGACQAHLRGILAEQIVGRLGMRIGAPIPPISLVDVPAELLQLQSQELGHLQSGIAHGSQFTPNCTDRQWLMYTDIPGNRCRFACLSLLYGWLGAHDEQLIYGLAPPHLVYSVDHGYFLCDAEWTPDALATVEQPKLDKRIEEAVKLRMEDYPNLCPGFTQVTVEDIAAAVAAPPDDWSITMNERVAIAAFIAQRHSKLRSVLQV